VYIKRNITVRNERTPTYVASFISLSLSLSFSDKYQRIVVLCVLSHVFVFTPSGETNVFSKGDLVRSRITRMHLHTEHGNDKGRFR